MSEHPFFSLSAVDGGGNLVHFESLRGKVVLIVNTASLCGFAPQFSQLQYLYDKYDRKDFEILAFPCNQFAQQEPGDDKYIQKYIHSHFNVSFPIMSKVYVNGRNEHPVYRFLKARRTSPLGFHGIQWNFEKFLIDRDGSIVARFEGKITPKSLEGLIDRLVFQHHKTVT